MSGLIATSSGHRPESDQSLDWIKPDVGGEHCTYSVDALESGEFDRILDGFDDSCLDQCHAYKESQWPGRTSTFLAYRNRQLIGGAVVVLMTLPVFGRGIANIRFGPFWMRNSREPAAHDYRSIIRMLAQEYAVKRGHMLTILPQPSAKFGALESDLLVKQGFQSSCPKTNSNRYFVDLRLSETQQMASLGQKWRYNLRKALASDLHFRRDDGVMALENFKRLHGQMVARKRVKIPDDLRLIEKLMDQPPAGIKPRIYFAYARGEPVVGAVTISMGDTTAYIFGASTDQALSTKAGYFLQWHIIKDLSGGNTSFYELGGDLNAAGLRQFKKGLVGRSGVIVPMQSSHTYCVNSAGYICGNAVQFIRYLKGSI